MMENPETPKGKPKTLLIVLVVVLFAVVGVVTFLYTSTDYFKGCIGESCLTDFYDRDDTVQEPVRTIPTTTRTLR